MDSVDIIDDVNALLKLGVGDVYRLEHIKQAYVQNKTIWVTDENYLTRLREKYLLKHQSEDAADKSESENKEIIHCWKCGKKGPLSATFCMVCGTLLFEVGTKSKVSPDSKTPDKPRPKKPKRSISLKIPVLIAIPVLVLIVLGAGYTQGYFDNVMSGSSSAPVKTTPVVNEVISSGETDSRCGPGTVYDSESNSCVLGTSVSAAGETDSRCGPGTVYDSESNSCVLG